ncbi:MAG: hypothetical protein B7Z20_03220 [Sphingobium sp. 32-64-5]|nr:MAG: hypothetical protein B7Z20_03220 [Sphingobium sp. 32-64-5]
MAAFARTLTAALGGTVLDLMRAPGGTSRRFWTFDLEREGRRLPLVALQDVGRGPLFGTRFDMGREARMLRALGRAGAAVPAVHHRDAAGGFMVLDRLPGRADFTFDDEAQRLAVIADFGRVLAALHRLDAGALDDLPIAPLPATRTQATLADIADYEDAYLRLCARHALVDDAFAWAKAHVPRDDAPPVVLQGDAGPTNFMHQDGHVVGLIDWEMAHAGDPHDDLAWIWFRVAMLGFDRDVAPWFRAYVRAAAMMIDEERLRYFIVLVTLRCTVANLVDARGGGPRALPPLGLDGKEAGS